MKTKEQIRARLDEIPGLLAAIEAGDEGFTQEQTDEMNALSEEFDGLTSQIEAMERKDSIMAKASAPAARKVTPAAPKGSQPEVLRSATDKFGGFQNSGAFLMAVKDAGLGKGVNEKLVNVMYERSGEDGGFLVPADISDRVVTKLEDPTVSLLARVNNVKVGGNSLHMQVDETTPWANGIKAYWTGEGEPIRESKPKFANVSMRLHKVAAMVKATDELLDDATALTSYIQNGVPSALTYEVNKAMISGDGVGKPLGFLNSPFALTVPKVGGQAADTIVGQNIIDMFSAFMPSMLPGAVWMGDVSAVAALNGLKDADGNYIYLQNGTSLNQGPYSTLMGLPVMPVMAGLPGLGDAGDLVLINPSVIWAITKAGGIKQATSIHLHFDREITAFRFSMRMDSQVPFKAPLTTESGYAMSGIVKLATRA